MVKKLDIPVHMKPPFIRLKPTSRPNCYKAPGYVRVAKESLTPDGYWES